MEYLHKIKAFQRLESLKKWLKVCNEEFSIWENIKLKFEIEQLKEQLKRPYIAVDAIIANWNKILLIERKNPPYGLALPGWFVDWWEDTKTAVLRELKEEVNIDWTVEKLVWVYDNPKRDPRKHVVSFVYKVKAKNLFSIEAGDDAKSYKWVDIEDIKHWKVQLVFDHKKIIEDL